jgi:hypothetical protein|tara:strand:+ start:106 stop:948 length:843 start_codon:yes stop_codon:yes gene_type:complete
MKDIESDETPENEEPILLFNMPLRFQNTKLILREFSRCIASILLVITLLGLFLAYIAHPKIDIELLSAQHGITFCSFFLFSQHALVYSNLVSNGWGNDKGKFWCEVKIMIARGFNTIRTSIRLFVTSLLFVIMAIELGVKDPITLLFLSMLAIISELNAGVVENQNQYDLPTNDKFVDSENQLLLEHLQVFQKEHPLQRVSWSPFVLTGSIQAILLVSLFWGSKIGSAFGLPCLISGYCISQLGMTVLHLCGVWTFVQLELFRSLVDVGIVTFSTIIINI